MKKFISFILFFVFLFGQESIVDRPNPCEDPLLKLAQNKGIKAIPVKDIPKFRKLMKACENEGGHKTIIGIGNAITIKPRSWLLLHLLSQLSFFWSWYIFS